jgi:hypothetical protein
MMIIDFLVLLGDSLTNLQAKNIVLFIFLVSLA